MCSLIVISAVVMVKVPLKDIMTSTHFRFRGGWQQLCGVEPSDVASQITSPRLTERWKRDKTFSV